MATTLECLVRGGYITAIKVYKINARVNQETIAEMGKWPDASKWYDGYVSTPIWKQTNTKNRVSEAHLGRLMTKLPPPRRVLLATEAVNAGITLPQVEWVISSMGVRRVHQSQRLGVADKVKRCSRGWSFRKDIPGKTPVIDDKLGT
eukprot:4140864-Amphidinium_carterae.1